MSPTSGTTDTTFSFSGAASIDPDGNVASYSWNFGDGSTASGVSVSRRYTAAGTYIVRLTVTDNSGAAAATATTVSVAGANQAPKTVLQVSPASGTVATSFAFSGAASADPDGSILSYKWRFGDGRSATGPTATRTYSKPDNYTVTLTVADNAGTGAQATTAITVKKK